MAGGPRRVVAETSTLPIADKLRELLGREGCFLASERQTRELENGLVRDSKTLSSAGLKSSPRLSYRSMCCWPLLQM